MKEDSLKKRYSIKLLANMIVGLINVIVVAVVPKALGPVAYGQFTFLQNFFAQIIGFFDAGTSIAFFTKLSARHDRLELIKFYFYYALFVLGLLIALIFSIDRFGYSEKVLPDIPLRYMYFGIAFGFLTWLTQVFIKISDARALTTPVEAIKIIHKIVVLLLLILLITTSDFGLSDYFYFHYVSLLSFLGILSLYFVKKRIFTQALFFLKYKTKELIAEFYAFSSPLLAVSVVVVLTGLLDIWLLQKYGGSAQTGFYGLAYSIAAMCFLFTSAMTPIITREFSKSYESADLEQMRKLFFRYVPMLYSIAGYFALFISFQSENLLAIFTDEKFKEAYPALVIIAFYPIHQTYGQLSGSIFYATGQTRKIRNITLIVQPIGLVLSFFLIYLFDLGAAGLAWKMVLVQLIGVNIQLYLNAKFLHFKMYTFVFHQIYSVLFFAVLAFASTLLFSFLKLGLLSFLLSGIFYTLFAIIAAYFFPQVFSFTREELVHTMKKVFNVFKKQT